VKKDGKRESKQETEKGRGRQERKENNKWKEFAMGLGTYPMAVNYEIVNTLPFTRLSMLSEKFSCIFASAVLRTFCLKTV
jgi:hypothetical protein